MIGKPRVTLSCAYTGAGADTGPMPPKATASAVAAASARIAGVRRRVLLGVPGSFIVWVCRTRMGANLCDAAAAGQRRRRSRLTVPDHIPERTLRGRQSAEYGNRGAARAP